MTSKTCANPNEKRDLPRNGARARALRYDNLGSVLVNLNGQVLPDKPKHNRTSGVDRNEIAQLRANLASVQAENERLAERFADELDRIADRLTELEARAHRGWWRRAFGLSRHEPEPAGRSRKKAVARLRALFPDHAAPKYRET